MLYLKKSKVSGIRKLQGKGLVDSVLIHVIPKTAQSQAAAALFEKQCTDGPSHKVMYIFLCIALFTNCVNFLNFQQR